MNGLFLVPPSDAAVMEPSSICTNPPVPGPLHQKGKVVGLSFSGCPGPPPANLDEDRTPTSSQGTTDRPFLPRMRKNQRLRT